MVKLARSSRESFQLDLIPMINVIFLLLIFFMLTANAITKNLDAELPEAKSAEKSFGKDITISLAKDHSVEIDGQVMEIKSLLPILKRKLSETSQKVVIIRADKNSEFGLFGKIIDIASLAGATDFMLATELPEVIGIN